MPPAPAAYAQAMTEAVPRAPQQPPAPYPPAPQPPAPQPPAPQPTAGREPRVTHVPPQPTLRQRAHGWLYAAVTTNPPTGHVDALTRWIVLTRAAVLPMTLFAGLLAGLLAVRTRRFDTVDYSLALVGILAAHVSNNVMNDLFDTTVGQDTAGYPRAQYAPHPILSGLTTRRRLAALALGVNAFDLAIMLALVARRGPWILAFALGGFLLSAAYTAPPLRLKKRGLGELDVLLTWGPLMVAGTYFAATGRAPWQVWVASLPYALLCTAVLMGKHTDKIAFDAPLGIRTVPVLLGRERALAATRGLVAGYYLLLVIDVAVGALPWPALLGLAGLPVARRMWGALREPPPAQRPAGFPVWPLWYAAWSFLHTRNAGAALIAGVGIAAVFDVHPF
jgi:1,4-dihydroxy-2-naphthoate octaprenyltransferase